MAAKSHGREGRRCKRKVAYAETDELLDFILSENAEELDVGSNKKSKNKKARTDDSDREEGKGKKAKGKNRPNSEKTKSSNVMKKAAFRKMIKNFRKKTSVTTVANFTRRFLGSELHIQKNENRMKIVQMLEETDELERTVRTFFLKALKIAEECLRKKPKDRQSVYRVKFTFYVRDIIHQSSSPLSKWFNSNKQTLLNENKDDFACVVHAIAMGIFNFIQSNMMELKHNNGNEADSIKEPMTTQSCYFIVDNWWWKVCVLPCNDTEGEKNIHAIPAALLERDRGWLFIPKWVFLPYLRLLDQTINLTVHPGGMKIYGDKLIQDVMQKLEHHPKELLDIYQTQKNSGNFAKPREIAHKFANPEEIEFGQIRNLNQICMMSSIPV
eukprot:gene1109-456_t